MSRGTRITFLAIAVVIAIVAIVVLADSSEDDSGSQTAATATPTETAAPTEASPAEETPTETPTPEPTPPPPPLLTANKVTELEATEGETVRFRARSATDDEVHVHGYDIIEGRAGGRDDHDVLQGRHHRHLRDRVRGRRQGDRQAEGRAGLGVP